MMNKRATAGYGIDLIQVINKINVTIVGILCHDICEVFVLFQPADIAKVTDDPKLLKLWKWFNHILCIKL